MAFVVDSSEWHFDGWTEAQVVEAIERILGRVQIALERGETIWIGDSLQTRSVLEDLDLWSLSAPDAPVRLPPEVFHELAAWLGSARRYLDDEWPCGMEETVLRIGNDEARDNEDVAWAHHHVRSGRAVACLGLTRSGLYETTSNYGAVPVHWVLDEVGHRRFWRAAIEVEGGDERRLEMFAPHAFPDLYFIDCVWRGLHRLGGGYLASRDEVMRYLCVLDDYGAWVFTCPPPALSPNEIGGDEKRGGKPTNQVIERRFLGFNLNVAPEKPNVAADPVCRNAREVTIGTKTLYCEWHGKIEPHRNRIHIHAPVPESGNRVVIAIIDEHLPLP